MGQKLETQSTNKEIEVLTKKELNNLEAPTTKDRAQEQVQKAVKTAKHKPGYFTDRVSYQLGQYLKNDVAERFKANYKPWLEDETIFGYRTIGKIIPEESIKAGNIEFVEAVLDVVKHRRSRAQKQMPPFLETAVQANHHQCYRLLL